MVAFNSNLFFFDSLNHNEEFTKSFSKKFIENLILLNKLRKISP